MSFQRIAGAVVAALAVTVVPVGVAHAGLTIPTAGPGITIVHGIGPAPQTVDVYLGGTDASEWELVLPGFEFGRIETADLPAGGYNVLICTAAGAPAETITSCANNGSSAVNGNSGTNVDVVEGVSELWIAAYGEPGFGRPVVAEVPVDLDCVEADAPARVTAVHAATAPEVDVLAAPEGSEPAPVVEDLAWGGSAALDVPAGLYDVAVELTDGTPVLEVPGAELAGGYNTVAVVVGNPQFDAVFVPVILRFPLEECVVPTTQTTVTPTTAPAPRATAQPTFTG